MNKETQEKISKAASRTRIGKHFGISSQAVGKWIYANGVPQKRIIPLCPHMKSIRVHIQTQQMVCHVRRLNHADTYLSE